MTGDVAPELQAAVAALAGSGADIGQVARQPLDYDAFLAGRTLVRVRGTARVADRTVAWSFIEKVTEGPTRASEYLYDNGLREFAAYRSGLLDDLAPGIHVPRLLRAERGDDGRLTLWVEDLAPDGRAPLNADDVALAARHLGRLAGRWIGRVPGHAWLFGGWIERHVQSHAIADGLAIVTAAGRDAGLEARLGGRLDEAARLIAEQGEYRSTLEGLVPTLCHHDAVAANVFQRDRDGGRETALIDWESIGPGPVGADLASLLFASPRRGDLSARLVPELIPRCLDAYVEGIREMEARVDVTEVRLGLHASIALRWTLVRDVVQILDGTNVARRGSAPHETSEEARDELVSLVPVLLDSAAEARRLMRR